MNHFPKLLALLLTSCLWFTPPVHSQDLGLWDSQNTSKLDGLILHSFYDLKHLARGTREDSSISMTFDMEIASTVQSIENPLYQEATRKFTAVGSIKKRVGVTRVLKASFKTKSISRLLIVAIYLFRINSLIQDGEVIEWEEELERLQRILLESDKEFKERMLGLVRKNELKRLKEIVGGDEELKRLEEIVEGDEELKELLKQLEEIVGGDEELKRLKEGVEKVLKDIEKQRSADKFPDTVLPPNLGPSRTCGSGGCGALPGVVPPHPQIPR